MAVVLPETEVDRLMDLPSRRPRQEVVKAARPHRPDRRQPGLGDGVEFYFNRKLIFG
jgi:hypothetical protein